MRVNLPTTGLSRRDLAAVIEMAAEQVECTEAPDGWRKFWSEILDALRAEQAQRRIDAAARRDPLGLYLFGDLT